MKKLALIAGAVLFIASKGWADSSTPRIGLVKPTIGSTGWGTKNNTNFDILDASAAVLNQPNTYSSSNTYTAPNGTLFTFNVTAGSFTPTNISANRIVATDNNGVMVSTTITSGNLPTDTAYLDKTQTWTAGQVFASTISTPAGIVSSVTVSGAGGVGVTFGVTAATATLGPWNVTTSSTSSMGINGDYVKFGESVGSTTVRNLSINSTVCTDGNSQLTTAGCAAGGGTVNNGNGAQISYYGATGTTLSGSSDIQINTSSVTVSTTTTFSGLTVKHVGNGSSSDDAAAFGQIPLVVNSTFTPTVTGAGTLAQRNGFYQQIGNMVHVWGTFGAGTVSGSGSLSIAVPLGSIVYTNRNATDGSSGVGTFFFNDGSGLFGGNSKFGLLFVDGSDTTNVYFTTKGTTAGTAAWPKPTPSTILNSTDYVSFDFWYAEN